MRIVIDTAEQTLAADGRRLDLYGKEAQLIVRPKHGTKYPIVHLARPSDHPAPGDLVRLQEAIVTLRPDVIIETGVAHGGSDPSASEPQDHRGTRACKLHLPDRGRFRRTRNRRTRTRACPSRTTR